MIHVLRVAGAQFVRNGDELIAPFDLTLDAGRRADVMQPTGPQASVAARLCAGIVKPTRGRVYIGDYDTRLQPAQAKRLVGFVDACGYRGDRKRFAREVDFRSAVWNVERGAARRRACSVLAAFGGGEERYARAVALALIAPVALVVLDQPPEAAPACVAEFAPWVALLTTRVSALAAFWNQLELLAPAPQAQGSGLR